MGEVVLDLGGVSARLGLFAKFSGGEVTTVESTSSKDVAGLLRS